jgi:hypothetical protein
MKRWVCAMATLAALACGDADESGPAAGGLRAFGAGAPQSEATENRAPLVTDVGFTSRAPTPGVPLEARFEASDPDGDGVTLEIEWRLNGRVVQSGDARSWMPGALQEGDRIELRVTASDGQLASSASASLRMGNRAPEIANVVLDPASAGRGDTLRATPVAHDPDGDELELAYEWLVNDEVVGGVTKDQLELRDASRGDRVRVRVRVSDPSGNEVTAESQEITLVNAAPRLEKFDGFETGEGGFSKQMKAVDPDGDRGLRFVLAEGPRGMTIDPLDGLLTWKPEPGTAGKFPVQVEVADPQGASSALRFELTLGGATSAAAPQGEAPPASGEAD